MLRGTIVGNIGGEPELRYTAKGDPFLRFNVASNGRVRDAQGEWQDKTEWVRVTVLGTRSETLANYLHKGTKVYAEGRLEARPWTGRDGAIMSGLELVAQDVEFMSPRDADQDNAQTAQTARPQPQRQPVAAGVSADLDQLPF